MSVTPLPNGASSGGLGLAIDSSEAYTPSKSLLSDKAILDHLRKGSVLIEPFVMENLSTSSYDVTLGRYYFRESNPEPVRQQLWAVPARVECRSALFTDARALVAFSLQGMGIYNPYDAAMVQRVWGTPQEAEEAGEWMARTGVKLENIHASDRIIMLKPGETILGHTNEFLGGRRTVTVSGWNERRVGCSLQRA
jgi:hypothetical protein